MNNGHLISCYEYGLAYWKHFEEETLRRNPSKRLLTMARRRQRELQKEIDLLKNENR